MAIRLTPHLALSALVTLLLASIANSQLQPICPGECDAKCPRTCEDPFDTDCAAQAWRFMEVCAWDGRRYQNECCAVCAGSAVRAYCAVPLALATMPNANPKLCTMYCSPDAQ